MTSPIVPTLNTPIYGVCRDSPAYQGVFCLCILSRIFFSGLYAPRTVDINMGIQISPKLKFKKFQIEGLGWPLQITPEIGILSVWTMGNVTYWIQFAKQCKAKP